jgi:hypothetical protein
MKRVVPNLRYTSDHSRRGKNFIGIATIFMTNGMPGMTVREVGLLHGFEVINKLLGLRCIGWRCRVPEDRTDSAGSSQLGHLVISAHAVA